MICTVKNPCNELFFNLVSNSKNEIKLVAPFVKSGIINSILKNKHHDSSLSLVTTSNLGAFASCGSDIECIKNLLDNNIDVYNYQNLHAKIYVFDNIKALVTSANLTHNGLFQNYEYGIYIEDEREVINSIINDHQEMIANESCGKFKNDDIVRIQNAIINMGKMPKINIDFTGDIVLANENIPKVFSKLNQWQKDVFTIINNLDGTTFTNKELQLFINYLKKIHPKSKTPDRTMSRVLQELRDMGLIKFESRGQYKKLWESKV